MSAKPENPLVSIVVPAYNAQATIGATLRSALSQSIDSIEVLVVDDGSTDDTVSIVESFGHHDERVSLIRQANSGVAAARNAGIQAARAPYIAPLDADDLWLPEKLAEQVGRLERGGDAMGMVYCWWATLDSYSHVGYAAYPWRVEGNVLAELVQTNAVGCASIPLFRTDVLREVGGYDAALRTNHAGGCEDWDLTLRVAERYAVGCVPRYLVGYRLSSKSMSSDTSQMSRSHRQVMDALARRSDVITPSLLAKSEAEFSVYLASVRFHDGDRLDGLRQAVLTAARCPSVLLRRWIWWTVRQKALWSFDRSRRRMFEKEYPFACFDIVGDTNQIGAVGSANHEPSTQTDASTATEHRAPSSSEGQPCRRS